MKRIIDRLHARVGDLWWYSLMIFVACRSGDVIQAFIGLWLVPKYVGTEELGAIMPLQNLSGFFSAPLAVLAAVFAKFVNAYSTHMELGKVKSYIRDTILFFCIVFGLCMLVAAWLAPHFYERLRITNGLLTVLILAAGFLSNVAQLFNNALQGLKKFKTMSFINVIGAPIRLITLLVAMPIRPLSGYILGQTTPPATSSCVALWSLWGSFKNVRPDTTWRKDIPMMMQYALPVAVWTVGCIVFTTLFTTLIRQRLPETESAAYYLLSKLSEVGGYFGMSISVVLFPLAAEAHEQGQEKRNVLKQSVLGSVAFSLVLAVFFAFCGGFIFRSIAIWQPYVEYSPLLFPLTIGMGISCATGAYVTYEMACRRFRPIWIVVTTNILWVAALALLMGCEALKGTLPDHIIAYMQKHSVANLSFIVWAGLLMGTLQFILVAIHSQPKRKA